MSFKAVFFQTIRPYLMNSDLINFAKSAGQRSRTIIFVLATAVALLFAANLARSYSLNQFAAMYDNPIYRWRESMAIALSRLQSPPLDGYLAYRSISNYLNQHGLGLMEGEVNPLPSGRELHALVFDGPRIETLIRAAATVPIDGSLPPVILHGNEKGLADFYYIAFRIFGIHVWAFTTLYFVILAISAVLFFLTFRSSPFCTLLLMLYLIASFYMLGFQVGGQIDVPHNSRFFPVLSCLATMHLLLLVLLRTPLRPTTFPAAMVQMVILYFVISIRLMALWQALALIASPLLVVDYRRLWLGWRLPRLLPTMTAETATRAWPALLVFAGLIGYATYTKVAVDKTLYRSETASHLFWDPLYGGLISSSPQLSHLYLPGCVEDIKSTACLAERYSDNMVYDAVLADLRKRHEVPPEIAYVSDGQIMINAFWNAGVYDRIARRIFFDVVRAHPLLAIKTLVYDKPSDQIEILSHTHLFDLSTYREVILMTLGAALAICFAGLPPPKWGQIQRSVPAVLFLCFFSSMTTMVLPSSVIVDTIAFYITLLLLVFVMVCLATCRWAFDLARQSEITGAST
jgi:hypothetical protein